MSLPTKFGIVRALVTTTAFASAENWPCFRGPTRQGVSTETGLPLKWSPTENVLRTANNLYCTGSNQAAK